LTVDRFERGGQIVNTGQIKINDFDLIRWRLGTYAIFMGISEFLIGYWNRSGIGIDTNSTGIDLESESVKI